MVVDKAASPVSPVFPNEIRNRSGRGYESRAPRFSNGTRSFVQYENPYI